MKKISLSIDRYFYVSTILMAALAFLLALVSDVFSLLAIISLTVIITIGVVSKQLQWSKQRNIILVILCWLGMAYSLIEVFTSRDVVYLGDALAYLIVLNLFGMKSKGRYWVVMVGALLLCFSGLVLEPGVVGYLIFIAYLFSATASLNSSNLFLNLHFRRDSRIKLQWPYFLQMIKSSPLGILLAVSVFIMFPRINRLAVEMPFQVKQRFKTGYSGAIDLSGQGQITENESVVMHVSSSKVKWLEKNALDLYLRGSALDTFDGKKWSKGTEGSVPYSRFQPLHNNMKRILQESLELEITTTPLRNRVIFLPESSFLLKSISKTVDRMLLDPNDGALYRTNDNPLRFRYVTQVFPKEKKLDQTIRTINRGLTNIELQERPKPYELSSSSLQRLLSIPPQLKSAPFFQEWVKSHSGSKVRTIGDLIRSLNNRFRANFQATLMNTFSKRATLESFLTVDKKVIANFSLQRRLWLFVLKGFPAVLWPVTGAVSLTPLPMRLSSKSFMPMPGLNITCRAADGICLILHLRLSNTITKR